MAGGVLKIDVDTRGLAKALREYQEATGKDLPTVVNRAAVNLAFRSAQLTKTADKFSVASGRGIYQFRQWVRWVFTSKGKFPPLTDDEIIKEGAKILRKRAAAVGYIRAGWVRAGKKIQQKAGNIGRVVSAPRVPAKLGRGYAIAARQAISTFAQITNASTSKSPTSDAALRRYGGDGLKGAIAFVTADMLAYARKKMAERAAKFNS
jgi:hypothetical protein